MWRTITNGLPFSKLFLPSVDPMIGGFGASADIGRDLYGGLGHELSHRFSPVAGYRALGVDYRDGSFQYDVIQQGPVLGGIFHFYMSETGRWRSSGR